MDAQRRDWVKVGFLFEKISVVSFLIFRYHLVCERDGDWRSLPRPQGLPQRRCHPLLLVHQHCQLWPDANCKILNISMLSMSNILHLAGPLWIQLHKSWGLWCGSDSDCIFQCRLSQSYRRTFCLHRIIFVQNYPFFMQNQIQPWNKQAWILLVEIWVQNWVLGR